MAEIATNKAEVIKYLEKKKASSIWPIPEPGPNQRGVTCGFYALAYVLKYWHERFEAYGGSYKTAKPLEARTNNATPKQNDPSVDKQAASQAKFDRAVRGEFSSLRHYGKFHHLTSYGSVFNADDLVKVALGENSQYAGQFGARTISVRPQTFVSVVKKLIAWECPVIVPFDADDDGEPLTWGPEASGKSAHWVAIIGWFADGNVDYAVYYNWGGFYKGDLYDFGASNNQLTSNKFLLLQKVEQTNSRDEVISRDYMSYKDYKIRAHYLKPIGKPVGNPEFNDPPKDGLTVCFGEDEEGLPTAARIQVGGLRNKVVAVYRAEDSADIDTALS